MDDVGRGCEQLRWRVSAEPVARSCGKASRRRAARGARARAERSDVPRCARHRGWEEPPAMGAERPSHGDGRTGSCRLHRQAKRAASDSERRRQGSSPEGRRPRSGLRGAGRGEAAPGGIEPGDRSEGPGGRPYLPIGSETDTGPSSAIHGNDRQAERIEDSPNKAEDDGSLAALDAMTGRGPPGNIDDGGVRSAAATCRPQDGEPMR